MSQETIKAKGRVPINRAGSDEEMAQGILSLAKNNYVNGEFISIDRGAFLKFSRR
jgi:NAD(P)-dependent dehydrogenase (short-subunit alcohol dehydrogenase family)